MRQRVLDTLKALRAYALEKGYEISLFYHEEDSYLMRFANSAISLNTNEHLIRLEIMAYGEQKRAGYELITNLDSLDEMKKGIDFAAAMLAHVQPLTYKPTVPHFTETFSDESGSDPELAKISNEEKLAYFNQAVAGLETEDIKLSGIFSSGVNTIAQISTPSEHTQYFQTTDAQISIVLSHSRLKWEVTAEQSAFKKSELDSDRLHEDLALLVKHYQQDPAQQIPLGKYDIVFGGAAIADLVNFMNWVGYNGGMMKRGFSFLKEEQVGKQVFSDQFNLVDNPEQLDTFPFKRDFMGMVRKPYPIFQSGVFQGFIFSQDDADEFGAQATGHTVNHRSMVVGKGKKALASLKELIEMPRDNDILYIPFLHYMNIVNPSKGVVTGSSRFGALLLKKDGTVTVPYNVRVTQSLLDIFGDKVEWLSSKTVPYNTSASYGARNPTAIIVPAFMRVNGLEISHSNASY